jgi:hypothetical protein
MMVLDIDTYDVYLIRTMRIRDYCCKIFLKN